MYVCTKWSCPKMRSNERTLSIYLGSNWTTLCKKLHTSGAIEIQRKHELSQDFFPPSSSSFFSCSVLNNIKVHQEIHFTTSWDACYFFRTKLISRESKIFHLKTVVTLHLTYQQCKTSTVYLEWLNLSIEWCWSN